MGVIFGLRKAAAVWFFVAVFPACAAVEFDLAGLAVGSDKRLSLTAPDALTPAKLYDITITASGSGTGALGELLGTGDLKTRLQPISTDVPDPFHVTLLNQSGRLPAFVKSVRGSATFFGLPFRGGTVDLKAQANLTFRARADGSVSLKASSIRLRAIDSGTGSAVDGEWTVTTGKIVVKEGGATAQVPRVDMLAQYYANQLLGNDFYTLQNFQTYVGVELGKGKTRTRLAVLQNDGPAVDDFRIGATLESSGVLVKFFDGKTDVTQQVRQGTFVVDDLPSGGLKILKVVFTKPRSVPDEAFAQVHVTGSRAAAPASRDVVSFVTIEP